MSPFIIRFISTIVATLMLLGSWWWLGVIGLKLVIILGLPIAALELIKILFLPQDSKSNKFVFYIFIFAIFCLSSLYPKHSAIIFAFFSVCFCLFSLLTEYKFKDIARLSQFQAKSILGFLYLGLLPSFLLQILDLPHGSIWFSTLLCIVFAGDIGAYLVGMRFGKTKLMPSISPKKSVEGAIGGLVSSTLASLALSFYLPKVPIYSLIILSLAISVVAQFGDLFESLLKRVAEVKDSGSLIPGHGGILDRMDGVLFASPVLLFSAVLLEGLLN